MLLDRGWTPQTMEHQHRIMHMSVTECPEELIIPTD